MLITEFTLDHPALQAPLRDVPNVEVEWEVTVEQPDGATQTLYWVVAGDFEAFHDALEADPETRDVSLQATFPDRRLYRIEGTDGESGMNFIPKVVDVGGVVQKAIGSADGWWYRAQLPDREAFRGLHTYAEAQDLSIEIHQLYSRTATRETPFLTAEQQELLLEAIDAGYLSIPRDASLADLAERLGISQSAASERFRRGVRALIEETVPPRAPNS